MKSTINYLGPMDRPPVWDQSNDYDRLNLIPTTVEIHDIRKMERAPSLDVEGFVLIEIEIEKKDGESYEDFAIRHCRAVEKKFPELFATSQALKQEETPKMFNTPPIVRYRNPPDGSQAMSYGDYIHSDFRASSGRKLFDVMFPGNTDVSAEGKARLKILQTWAAISPPPQDAPLTLVDKSSLKDEDIVPGVIMTGRPGDNRWSHEIYLLKPSPAHKWYYVANMKQNEVLIWIGHDDDKPNESGPPHTSCINTDDLEFNSRISYETRSFIFFKN